MDAEQQRLQALRLREDEIGRMLEESRRNGELTQAPSWGRPLNLEDGYAQTPEEWRMPYKILKDAGCVPPEVELMQRIAALQAEIDGAGASSDTAAMRQRLVDLRQLLALRLEQRGRAR